jgi:flagellar assembly factor FliW
LKWFKGNKEIRDSSKYTIRNFGIKHFLQINNVEFEDASEYSAVLSEEEKTTAKLDVIGKYLNTKT